MRGKTKDRAHIIDRQRTALSLRKQGMDYRRIGDHLGVSRQQAFRDVEASLIAASKERNREADKLLDLELERLDMLLEGTFPFAAAGNPPSVIAFLKVMERRSKYLGLDAPTKFEFEGLKELLEICQQRGIAASEVFAAMIQELQSVSSATDSSGDA